MNRPQHTILRLLVAGAAALNLSLAMPGCGNELHTVVEAREHTVLVRDEDGFVAEVLNDLAYELVPGQQVKVTGNCEGFLHVAAAYAVP